MAIWSKGGDETAALVHEFTVGDDFLYDRVIAPYDCLGSLAHVAMLAHVGLLPADQARALSAGLRDLHRGFIAGAWTVEAADEDVHSKIEALLTTRLGDAGRRLHTGRSRNDQVLTAIRLWQKHELCRAADGVAAAARALLTQARTHEFHPFPGYTHWQRAMPSSLGMFFASHAQALVDDLALFEGAFALSDSCPLGSGAGYGVGLPLDRAMTATLLGFARVGLAGADGNGRGKVETAVLDALGAVVNDLSRLAADLVFFTSAECGFFTIAAGFTTGSSIMPQKRNLDLFELLRGRASRFLGLRTGLFATTVGLPSGYSRDLQDTKALCIDGVRLARQGLAVVAAAVPTLQPVRERILAALTPEIYATDEAYRLVRDEGVPFREAYQRVGKDLARLGTLDHDAVVRGRTHAGSTGALGLDALARRLDGDATRWRARADALTAIWDRLLDG
ncbi:MAG TPA: argininosuccinate lyase [Planctomycetota bacterium]|nr:argininosuccinate lyase [Planctomycetota bacterium]